ncbi:hypothetical protein ACJ73_08680 [Blastomyces percursus]|uniref:Uncharacterized protein n=1 Tax=Blastomyces percursus TaxID=1658174 RepID=A0A1J9QFH6_9EURO|nr:hypothetical protein ACJ73_08680 [Blastomyces percursus]
MTFHLHMKISMWARLISNWIKHSSELRLMRRKDVMTVLSKQGGRLVLERDYSYVSKGGTAVRRFEIEAMKLVAKRTSVPLPEVIYSLISDRSGEIGMTTIPGTTLESLWDKLNRETKKSICHETWDQIAKLREIPQPPALRQFFQCLADGSPTLDL